MSGRLPNWLAQWLGIEPAPSGEGTAYALDHQWPLPPWLTVLLLAAVVGYVVYLYAKEGGTAGFAARAVLAALRLAVVGVVLFFLAQFVLSLQRTGLPYVVVILDDSASMETADHYDTAQRDLLRQRVEQAGLAELSRLNLGKAVLLADDAALLRRLGRDYRLKVYFASEDARPTQADSADLAALAQEIRQAEAPGRQSRLGLAVRRALDDLRGAPPAAIVFLTDGVTTQGETLADAALYAQRRGVPIVTVGLGSDQAVQDLKLHDPLYDDVVFKNDLLSLEAKLTAQGFQGRRVRLVLKTKEGSPLAETEVVAGPDGQPRPVRLTYRPTSEGQFEHVLEATAQPEEIEAGRDTNNRLPVRFTVRDDKVRVLLVQDEPSFEFRYLKHMLERNATVELHTVLQQADTRFTEIDKTALRVFPVKQQELFEYHVILFGDVNPAQLGAGDMANLRQFVEQHGGGVAFLSGPRHTPLAYRGTPLEDLLPIDLAAAQAPPADRVLRESFHPRLTRLGQDMPHMQIGDSLEQNLRLWQETLPGFYWLLEASKLKPAASVLAEHPTRTGADGKNLPVICLQYFGAGKVLFHATDETWRWRYLVGDVYFQRYWIQAVRFLARGRLLQGDRAATLKPLRSRYQRGEAVGLRVRFLDEAQAPADDQGVTVVVQSAGENRRRLTLSRKAGTRGVFEGEMAGLPPGDYRVWIASPGLGPSPPSADFTVEAPVQETQRLQMDTAQLQWAAQRSGGVYLTPLEAPQLAESLPRGRPVPTEPLPPAELWHSPWLLGLFLLLISAEWMLRKRKGML